jgi:alpha-D-ribose 1-methylphosphonate 5-triphosphate synthase subunit PhnH
LTNAAHPGLLVTLARSELRIPLAMELVKMDTRNLRFHFLYSLCGILALAAFVPLDHAIAARRIAACHQGAVKAVFRRYFPMENQEYAHASDVVGNTGRWSKRSRN